MQRRPSLRGRDTHPPGARLRSPWPTRRIGLALAAILLATAGPVRAGAVEDARALLKEDDPAAAELLLRARLRATPGDPVLLCALGDAARVRCALDRAEEAYRLALERAPFDPDARAGLGEVFLLRGRPAEALVQAERALEGARAGGRETGRVWRVKALALLELRRFGPALDAARRAVALAPDDPRCAEAHAAVCFRSGRMAEASASYLRATELDPRTEEGSLRLGNGFAPDLHASKPWRDGPEAQDFRAALDAWDAGDLGLAEATFRALVRRDPDTYKYRLGVGLCRVSIRRSREAAFGGDPTTLYARLPAPALDGLASVVHGADALPPLELHVVRVATAPARPLFEAMRAARASHDLLRLDEDVTDAEHRRDLLGKRTFDGRWYAHLRAVAGPHGATGAEKLREAAEFAFNTFAHEFGHQVHRFGLSTSQQEEVTAMYREALASGACLDYYAASNEDEYFAQEYEAFVSPAKRGCLPETARHTRDELARRDPRMFAFLRRVLDTSHESEEVFMVLRRAAAGLPVEDPQPEPSTTR